MYRKKYFIITLYVIKKRKLAKPLVTKIAFETSDVCEKEIKKRLITKKVPFDTRTENRILKESCALVYLTIPVYVFTFKKTALLIKPRIKMFLYNSGKPMALISKFCLKL